MRNKVARSLRKMAVGLTEEGAPFAKFESRHVKQLVPHNWEEYQKTQEKDYDGPPVKLDFEPIMTATFFFTWGCTENIYKQLKGVHKRKPIPIPPNVKMKIGAVNG